jgi:hypothetical protein
MTRRNWKTTFQAGVYASPDLRTHKIHRDLLSFLTFRTHQTMRVCWPSQAEIAAVLECSVRNVHDLLVYLEKLGAIFPVKVTDLPKRQQALIRTLTPNKSIANAKAYYLCEDWAQGVLESTSAETSEGVARISISKADREKGRKRANDRRRRYAPKVNDEPRTVAPNPFHDDWLFLNGAPGWTGSPTSAPELGWTGSPTTDMTYDINPAPTAAINIAIAGAEPPLPFPAKNPQRSNSSLTVQQGKSEPHGYGDGEASACDPSPPGLARPEGTEYDAARACEITRRAS